MDKESNEIIDKLHDTYTDLIISLFFSLPFKKRNITPNIGDWVINSERLSCKRNPDHCIGILKEGNEINGKYKILTVGGCEVSWHNTEFKKLPTEFMREDKEE